MMPGESTLPGTYIRLVTFDAMFQTAVVHNVQNLLALEPMATSWTISGNMCRISYDVPGAGLFV
jgi:hypothetical protein